MLDEDEYDRAEDTVLCALRLEGTLDEGVSEVARLRQQVRAAEMFLVELAGAIGLASDSSEAEILGAIDALNWRER